MSREYVRPIAILKHAREMLGDPNHWAQSTLCDIILFDDGDNGKMVVRGGADSVPYLDLKKIKQNELCVYCVLGAVRHFTKNAPLSASGMMSKEESLINKTVAGRAVEDAARELYPSGDYPVYPLTRNYTYSRAVAVNDGEVLQTQYGAYKATLRILDRAIEKVSA